VGHMCILTDGPSCHCGGHGCLEACVSGWALVRDAENIAHLNPDSAIARLPSLTPSALAELAGGGDHQAKALWEKAGRMLGTGIANLMNLLNPECIVLVGGLAKAGDLLLDPAKQAWETQAFDRAWASTSVKIGTLSEWAGVRGAIQPFLEK
ncbi:ROK family protein, partial [Nitrospinota bacterium]